MVQILEKIFSLCESWDYYLALYFILLQTSFLLQEVFGWKVGWEKAAPTIQQQRQAREEPQPKLTPSSPFPHHKATTSPSVPKSALQIHVLFPSLTIPSLTERIMSVLCYRCFQLHVVNSCTSVGKRKIAFLEGLEGI